MTNIPPALLDLLDSVMSLNRDNFHTFIYWSGHVSQIDINTYAGGWKEGCTRSNSYTVDLRADDQDDNCREIRKLLLAESEANDKVQAEKREYERLKAIFAPEAA